MAHLVRSTALASPTEQEPVALWGGVEYTYNRVGDRYLDQMELSGHAQRPDDYEEFVRLGIRTLRFGLLWERHELDGSWRWSDKHLHSLRRLGVRPIAGLVHHGSGPPHTNLLDPEFAPKLADYAGKVAARYPWIDAYTPINEPNTTARFSGRYGLWYPHHQSRTSYLRTLVNQLKGTVLSMQAIRRVRSDAQFIQTEDVGDISGTAELQDIWETLNLRQWLPYDLLCGRVDRHHPMFEYMRSGNISEAEIFWFAEHPCPPETIGVNYYVTSDRYLDHRTELYPDDRASVEGDFVDVEAARVLHHGIAGIETLLLRAWERYKIPVAVTEVHLGCSADEQIRWLAESWEGVMQARRKGVECAAMTVWALLGSYYWNQLVTCENGHYEPGVFDVRSGSPVATDLAKVAAQIAHGIPPCHPALLHSGWWRSPNRILFPYAKELAA